MRVRIEIYDSLAALPEGDWSRLSSARSVFQDLAWYQRAPAPGRLRLVAAYDPDGRPLALLPLFVLERPTHYYHTPREVFCGFRERALLEATAQPTATLDRAREAEWFPSLLSISPFGYRGGLIAASRLDSAEVYAAIARAVDRLCQDEGVRVAAHYYLNEEDDGAWLDALGAQGAWTIIVGADCNLDLRWQSLSEYFREFGPRGRRLRAQHRRFQAVRRRAQWLMADEEAPLSQTLTGMFATTAQRYQEPDPPLSLYNSVCRSWSGRRLLLTIETPRGDTRSGLLVLSKDNKFYPKFYGTDGARDDYFHLTFTWLLEFAIAEGITRIEYGGGSHQAKLLRGARLRWLFASLQIYDRHLAARLDEFIPYYQTAKQSYFTQLALRYHVDHAPPPPIAAGLRYRASAR